MTRTQSRNHTRLARALGGALIAAAVLSTGALAAPAEINEPGTAQVWVAHGIPGAKVDVCVNGDAVRTGFLYGGRFRAEVPAYTPLTVKVRAHDGAGACTGAVLIRARLSLNAGANVTALATLRAGEATLVTWSNRTPVAGCGGGDTSVTVHHEAKAGPMLFFWITGGLLPAGLAGIQIPRTASFGPFDVPAGPNIFAATPFFGATPFVDPTVRVFAELTDYQLILVGTNAENYRWIRFGNPALFC
ncbi:MAG: hypothetical protein ACKOTZ_04480 [Chloroflexota bacterium]